MKLEGVSTALLWFYGGNNLETMFIHGFASKLGSFKGTLHVDFMLDNRVKKQNNFSCRVCEINTFPVVRLELFIYKCIFFFAGQGFYTLHSF